MLPSVLESEEWGSERYGIKLLPGDIGMMREGDHSTFRRLWRVLRGLRRQGRRGQHRSRSRRVGEDWTDGFDKSICNYKPRNKDKPLSVR